MSGEQSEHKLPGLVSLCLSSLCLLPQLFLQFKIIQKNGKRCNVSSIRACHCSIFCNTCFIIWQFTASILAILTDDTPSFNVHFCLFYYSTGFFLLVAKISLFLFYVIRLRDIFSETVLAYTSDKLTSVMVFLSCLYLFAAGAPLFTWVLVAINTSNYDYSNPSIHNFAQCSTLMDNEKGALAVQITLIASFMIAEIIANTLVVRLYLSRLVPLSLSLQEGDIDSRDRSGSVALSTDSAQTVSFFSLAMKVTNSLLLTVTSTIVVLLSSVVVQTPQYWMVMDCLINSLSIYSSFSFGDKVYQTICCCPEWGFRTCVQMCFCCVSKNVDANMKRPGITNVATQAPSRTATIIAK